MFARVDRAKKISYSSEWIFTRGGSLPGTGTAVSEMVGRHSMVGADLRTTLISSPWMALWPSPVSIAKR